MESNYKWLQWAKSIQSISQIGLTYAKDKFDIERYCKLRDISIDILNKYTEVGEVKLRELFINETGYQTPKVDVRAAVFSDSKILLVQEQNDLNWCMPGGWIDVECTLKQATIKEVKEESGLDCLPKRIISVYDRRLHAKRPVAYTIFTFFIECDLIAGKFEQNLETLDAKFFGLNDIPKHLAKDKTTIQQIKQCFLARNKKS
jgi:ADP-ribose pyrophosphatase YjhB (NUDIX family)